jgi:hypothetical protein
MIINRFANIYKMTVNISVANAQNIQIHGLQCLRARVVFLPLFLSLLYSFTFSPSVTAAPCHLPHQREACEEPSYQI